jgi:hypothetical protein
VTYATIGGKEDRRFCWYVFKRVKDSGPAASTAPIVVRTKYYRAAVFKKYAEHMLPGYSIKMNKYLLDGVPVVAHDRDIPMGSTSRFIRFRAIQLTTRDWEAEIVSGPMGEDEAVQMKKGLDAAEAVHNS